MSGNRSCLDKSHVTVCDQPIAVALDPDYHANYCHYCFLRFAKLLQCGHCTYTRYCSKRCQKLDWRLIHKLECSHLNGISPNSLTIAMTSANHSLSTERLKVCHMHAMLIFRLKVLQAEDKLSGLIGTHSGRKFDDLAPHRDDVVQSYFSSPEVYLLAIGLRKTFPKIFPDVFDDQDFDFCLDLVGRVIHNRHGLYDWKHSGLFFAIGSAICLDFSAYAHSCWPTAHAFNHGRTLYVVPLTEGSDTHDIHRTTVARFCTQQPRLELSLTHSARDGSNSECWCAAVVSEGDCNAALKCEQCGAAVALAIDGEDYCFEATKCTACSTGVSQERRDRVELLYSGLRHMRNFSTAADADLNFLMDYEAEAQNLLVSNNWYLGILRWYILQLMDQNSPNAQTQEYCANLWAKFANHILYPNLECCEFIHRYFCAAFALTCVGKFDLVASELAKIEGAIANSFALVDAPVPFEELLLYLKECVEKKNLATGFQHWYASRNDYRTDLLSFLHRND